MLVRVGHRPPRASHLTETDTNDYPSFIRGGAAYLHQTLESKMYIPAAYRAPDPRAIIKAFPFATLVTMVGSDFYATSTPLYFETDDKNEMHLIGHLARANPQTETIVAGAPALAIFSGPNAYISANWYAEKLTVPTWNYVVAQVRGALTPIDDEQALRGVLDRTAQCAEAWSPSPWTQDCAPPGKIDALLPQILAFRIVATEIVGATKLSQTHPVGDRTRVIDRLETRSAFGDQHIADLMRGLDAGDT